MQTLNLTAPFAFSTTLDWFNHQLIVLWLGCHDDDVTETVTSLLVRVVCNVDLQRLLSLIGILMLYLQHAGVTLCRYFDMLKVSSRCWQIDLLI